MYSFQIFELIYSENYNLDTENIWWLLPVCMVVIPVVYFIRIKLYDKYVNGIDLDAMEAELIALKEKQGKANNTNDPEKAFKKAQKLLKSTQENNLTAVSNRND